MLFIFFIVYIFFRDICLINKNKRGKYFIIFNFIRQNICLVKRQKNLFLWLTMSNAKFLLWEE